MEEAVSIVKTVWKVFTTGVQKHLKCCVLVCQKYKQGESVASCGNYDIFMSDVKWCGHDSRGNITYTYTDTGEKVILDEVPLVADRYREMR